MRTPPILHLLNLFYLTAGSWIDEDTPPELRTTTSLVDGTEYHLVMSDEFNLDERSFEDGNDPTWTALEKSDDDMGDFGGSLHFYNASRVYTKDGYLHINSRIEETTWSHYYQTEKTWKTITRNFASGMLQSWNKFCFTGGIVEIEIQFPGKYNVGGLWPAVWFLGNLARATYEPSTNLVWPWSFDRCDRNLQPAQKLSACNTQNHFGLHPGQGRGSTEIDFLEVMAGDSKGSLPNTDPPIHIPYTDMTLQVAPGFDKNRPPNGARPNFNATNSTKGHIVWPPNNWYRGLEYNGNCSLNPYFYGTYLAETKPNEPVVRTKKEAFQADAVSAMYQLVKSNFQRIHKFRLEWQPGDGGRVDWFAQAYKYNETYWDVGDGNGTDWVRAYTIKDESLKNAMGAKIPEEPSYVILNTAISSTWGFPYSFPPGCEKCYDCSDSKCNCAFSPGFCEMMKAKEEDGTEGVTMKIDSIRIYQSRDPSAHVGQNHTIGCDPLEYPTRNYIKGHEYLYMRPLPWVLKDYKYGSLRPLINGTGACKTDDDCGTTTRGKCMGILETHNGLFGKPEISTTGKVCECNDGWMGKHCLAQEKEDGFKGAYEMSTNLSLFRYLPDVYFPLAALVLGVCILSIFLTALMVLVGYKKRTGGAYTGSVEATPRTLRRPKFRPSHNPEEMTDAERQRLLMITGTSV